MANNDENDKNESVMFIIIDDDKNVPSPNAQPRKRKRYNLRNTSSRRRRSGSSSKHNANSEDNRSVKNCQEAFYNIEEWAFYSKLSMDEKKRIAIAEKNVASVSLQHDIGTPSRFRLLMSEHIPDDIKHIALKKSASLSYCNPSSGEYMKMLTWLEMLERIPFTKSVPMGPDLLTCSPIDMQHFLQHASKCLDDAVYGHEEVKKEVINFVAQRLVNPNANGKILCLAGPPGIAKTHLVRNGISKALGLPFSMIALGGSTDGAFLDGHGYTYEGSRPGIIVQELIRTGCNNPVIFFDELDKVSLSHHRGGDEVINILLHVTDPTQNECFRDKYFADIPIDLSKSFIIFSCNDADAINRILRDRLTILHMSAYGVNQKIAICKNHLIRDIASDFGLSEHESISIDDATIRELISIISEEDGVRGLKKSLHSILAAYITELMLNGKSIRECLPISIDRNAITKYLSPSYYKNHDMSRQTLNMMYI